MQSPNIRSVLSLEKTPNQILKFIILEQAKDTQILRNDIDILTETCMEIEYKLDLARNALVKQDFVECEKCDEWVDESDMTECTNCEKFCICYNCYDNIRETIHCSICDGSFCYKCIYKEQIEILHCKKCNESHCTIHKSTLCDKCNKFHCDITDHTCI